MSRRTPLLLALVVGAGLLVAPAPPTQALWSPHDVVVSENPADDTPHVLDSSEHPPLPGAATVKVNAILPMGGRVYVGGTFTGVRNSSSSQKLVRHGLFALDPATRQVDPAFVADVDAAVEALAPSPDGTAVFAAGAFNTVNGGDFPKLAKLDARTGSPVAGFRPRPSAEVKDIALAGNRLLLAGPFSSVQGQSRGGLAALDAGTGALDPGVDIPFDRPRQGSIPRVEAIVVTPDGTTLAVGGNFTRAAGVERWQVALLDITAGRPAALVNWHTDRFNDTVVSERSHDVPACASGFDSHVKDMDMSPDGSYFVVVTTGGYTSRGPLCDTASRWDTSARGEELQPVWDNYVGGDTLTGVAATGAAVYVSGHFRWMNNYHNDGSASDANPGDGSVEREAIAALDPLSGLPLPWNPRRERGHGAQALVSSPEGLWVGSDTNFVGNGTGGDGHRDPEGDPRPGEYHPKLAFFPTAGGTPVSPPDPTTLPADLHGLGDDGMTRRPFDGTHLGSPTSHPGDWSGVRGAFTAGGRVYTATDEGTLLRHAFDGTTLSGAQEVDLVKDSEHDRAAFDEDDIAEVTGMFFDRGRIYYTRQGDRDLYYRYFLSQPDVADDIVGDRELEAGGDGDWSDVEGMAMAGGQIFWLEDGDLYRLPFQDGRPTGTRTVVQRDAGLEAAALFLWPSSSPPSPPPPGGDPPAVNPPPPPDGEPPAPGGSGPSRTGRSGYWMVASDGRVYPFGDAGHLGDATPHLGGTRAVDLEPTGSGEGYWVVDGAGRVYASGDAAHLGNADPARLDVGERVTSLSATPSGAGYWLFTDRGRALTFGDARPHGDVAEVRLNGPVLDSIPTPSGNGYYMVASDGGIFAFGDARFHGSMGGKRLNAPVQSLVPDPDGTGYWLVAADGGVFAFEAGFRGSMGATPLNQPVTGMVAFGHGYLMVATDGGIFNFSDRPFLGSLGDHPPAHPVVAVAALH